MEKILILDFGSQYTQLIARRVRELNVYCEIHPFNKIPAIDASVRGVILSGSPFSVRDEHAPAPDLSAIKGKLPLLGVCYGAQFLASAFGGEVQPAPSREYGRAMLTVGDASDALMRGLPARTQVWMSHGDTITRVPDNYELIASTEDVRVAAFHVGGEQTWGIQFHPEVYHSTDGTQLLKNFVVDICGCGQSWTSEGFVEATVRELREKLGDDKVVLALSGGVDSSYLLAAAKQCGAEVRPYFVRTAFQPEFELEDARRVCRELGTELTVLEYDILSVPGVAANPPERCYYCKRAIFSLIRAHALSDGCDTLIDGNNASDDASDRPGMRAVKELGVLSPLRICGLTKEDIRARSRELGLFTASKPAYACLATRVSTGTAITAADLRRVERAEDAMRAMGFDDFRVRIAKDGAARLELRPEQMPMAVERRSGIMDALGGDFERVVMDLKGR